MFLCAPFSCIIKANLLKGKQIPRLDTAIKLAATLGVPLEALTEGIHWTPAVSAKGKFDISGPNR